MLEFSCQTSASLRYCAVRLATCKKKALPRLEKVYLFEDTSMCPASRRKWKIGNGILPISFPPFVSRSTGQAKQSSRLMASNFKSPALRLAAAAPSSGCHFPNCLLRHTLLLVLEATAPERHMGC